MDVDRRLDPHVALFARGHLEVEASRELEAAGFERRLERVQLGIPGVRRHRLQALAERGELELELLARGPSSAGGRRGRVRDQVDAVVEHEEVIAPSEVARARELAQRVERPSLAALSDPHRDAPRGAPLVAHSDAGEVDESPFDVPAEGQDAERRPVQLAVGDDDGQPAVQQLLAGREVAQGHGVIAEREDGRAVGELIARDGRHEATFVETDVGRRVAVLADERPVRLHGRGELAIRHSDERADVVAAAAAHPVTPIWLELILSAPARTGPAPGRRSRRWQSRHGVANLVLYDRYVQSPRS